MSGQRSYVVATAADIDQREAYCRPAHLEAARAHLDANGQKGVRLRSDDNVPDAKVVVFDPPTLDDQFTRAWLKESDWDAAHAAWAAASWRFSPTTVKNGFTFNTGA